MFGSPLRLGFELDKGDLGYLCKAKVISHLILVFQISKYFADFQELSQIPFEFRLFHNRVYAKGELNAEFCDLQLAGCSLIAGTNGMHEDYICFAERF